MEQITGVTPSSPAIAGTYQLSIHPWLKSLCTEYGVDPSEVPLETRALSDVRSINKAFLEWHRTRAVAQPRTAPTPVIITIDDSSARSRAEAELRSLRNKWVELQKKLQEVITAERRQMRRIADSRRKVDYTNEVNKLLQSPSWDYQDVWSGIVSMMAKNVRMVWTRKDQAPIEVVFGDMIITVQLSTGKIKAHATQTTLRSETTQYIHPHVSRDGDICLGNMRGTIVEALSEDRLADVFTAARAVLENYNEESPYIGIEHWRPGPVVLGRERVWVTEEFTRNYPLVEILDSREADDDGTEEYEVTLLVPRYQETQRVPTGEHVRLVSDEEHAIPWRMLANHGDEL